MLVWSKDVSDPHAANPTRCFCPRRSQRHTNEKIFQTTDWRAHLIFTSYDVQLASLAFITAAFKMSHWVLHGCVFQWLTNPAEPTRAALEW